MLGQAKREFGQEYWNHDDKYNAFKIFVTGISGESPDGSPIRQPDPYAVKKVIIRSTHLAMKNIVIYDVPRFADRTA